MKEAPPAIEDQLLYAEALLKAAQHQEALQVLSEVEKRCEGDEEVLRIVKDMRSTRSLDPAALVVAAAALALLVLFWFVGSGAHAAG